MRVTYFCVTITILSELGIAKMEGPQHFLWRLNIKELRKLNKKYNGIVGGYMKKEEIVNGLCKYWGEMRTEVMEVLHTKLPIIGEINFKRTMETKKTRLKKRLIAGLSFRGDEILLQDRSNGTIFGRAKILRMNEHHFVIDKVHLLDEIAIRDVGYYSRLVENPNFIFISSTKNAKNKTESGYTNGLTNLVLNVEDKFDWRMTSEALVDLPIDIIESIAPLWKPYIK